LGTAVPEYVIENKLAGEITKEIFCATKKQGRTIDALFRLSGVKQRHISMHETHVNEWLVANQPSDPGPPEDAPSPGEGAAGCEEGAAARRLTTAYPTDGPSTRWKMEHYQQHAFPLAREAALGALEEAGVAPAEITHLVTVSCTGFYAPGVDVQLIQSLGLPTTTERTHVGFMGCHAAINGLRAANAYATSDPAAVVLLCAVEVCSPHYTFRWDPQRIVSNALFADGAAAVVGRMAPPAEATAPWSVVGSGSCLLPDSKEAMSWKIGDHGFEMTLASNVPEIIVDNLRPWLTEWLEGQGYALSQIESWIIHPGGPRIVEAVGALLELPREATAVSRQVLAEYGNMSSPTVLFILERMMANKAKLPCVMIGFGPGLVAEAVLFA
jgi:predicted naringenin-chalcone synthase